jgi:hypothetical protein
MSAFGVCVRECLVAFVRQVRGMVTGEVGEVTFW